MKKNARTGSRLFFIEFLIVIFFFLIISTVCLRLFAAAHMTTQKAGALSCAQQISSSIAELTESGIDSADELPEYFPDAVYEIVSDRTDSTDSSDIGSADSDAGSDAAAMTTSVIFCYDRDFAPCSKEDAFYTVTASITVSGHQKQADIVAKDRDGAVLYELPVTFHVPMTKVPTESSGT